MACFLVPTTEAVVATAITQVIKMREQKKAAVLPTDGKQPVQLSHANSTVPFSRKLQWLCNLLWGGALLLAFEHLWHGEVVPWFPFLTAANNPADTAAMLHEMFTVGVSMAIVVTLAWCGMLAVSHFLEKRTHSEQTFVR